MFPHYFAFLITKIEKKKEKDYCLEWESNLEQIGSLYNYRIRIRFRAEYPEYPLEKN